MFYCTALLLLAATADVFGHTLVRKSSQVGVVGGDTVPISKVPYMADLRRGGDHWCAATIIDEQFVLTAAYCIEQNVTYTVAVGTDDARGGDIYEVDKAIPHEKSPTHHDYNICLVKLQKHLVFGPNVRNIILAAEPYVLEPETLLTVTGWGRTSEGAEESEVLRQVSVPLITQTRCKEIYSDVSSDLSGFITDKVLCAGHINSGKGPCDGDGGSPLVYNNVQLGITSGGAKCGNLPAIYTKISAFEDWIIDTIAKNT